MKKFLLSLVSLLMFVIGGVWADDAFYTLDTTLEEVATDGNAYANVNNASVGGIDWAFQGNGQQHPWRLGGKNLAGADRVVYTKTAMGADINSVKLTVAEANNITVNSLKLVVASDPDFADVTDEVAKEFAAESEITFVPSTGTSWAKDSYYKFVFNVSVEGSSNRFLQFSKVEFFAAASEPAAETITLKGIEYELKSENLFVNGSFTDGVAGWKTIGYTTDAVESNFTLTAEGGYDGGAFITTNGAGVGSENTIRQSVAVTQGKTYYFAVRTSGKAPDTSNFNYNALFKMTDAVTENGVIKAFEWPQGAGQTSAEWSTTAIVFTAETDYVGVRMGWNSASSFDGFELYEVEQLTSPLDAAKLEKLAAIDALQIVGDGLFQYSQTAIDDAKAAVNAATTVEEVEAVAMPAVTAPDAEKFYSFKLKEGGNYLAADGGIKLAEKAMGFKFVAAEGGYALTADGTNYVAFIGTDKNTWSMGLTEAPYTWVVTCLADGEYTLSKVGKPAECIGVDDTTAGSSCFANKPADAKGTWAIAEYVAPVLYNVTVAEDLENGTVVASPVQAEEGETVTLTITPAEGYELDVLTVKAGENDVEVSGNTFAMPAADVTVSATFKEQTEPTPEPEVFTYQKYIIKNVESGMFWGAGNDWGTQASLVAHPEYVKLDPNGDGTYKLESQVNNGGTNYYFNGEYMDNDQPVALTITKLENGNYTIANGTNYFGWDGTSTVLGKNLAADSKNAEWTIQSLDDAKAALANATVEAPMDATLLIEDHDFGRNNRYENRWTIEASYKSLSGGNNKNNCAESYRSTFTLSQVLKDAPKGVYAMTAQGFYRQDGTDNDNLPYFYANEEKATFPLLTGSENSMAAASESFTAGKYTIDPIFVKVEEGGTLTIGAKLETNTALWCIWDNFVLTYYGNCDLAEAKFSGLVAQVNALKAEAEALVANTGNVSETTVAALQAAIAATENIEATEEAYKAVINGLTAAVNQGKLDVDNKAAIDAMYALIKSTNVYTAEAKTTYTAEADGYKAAWEAGTLTTKVDNPATIHAWHAANTADDFLLSAWTINDVQAKEFDTALYINTWSNEGEKDGSEFKVPFFEYWTGDANSLGTAKLTATMTGLTAGLYEVSAWVRVRAKNGFTAPATGITMDVNGGEATDVAAGTQVENTQFFLANFKAVGVVGEDGVLKANFNVAADNNISWLSFKNVKFAPKDETEYAYEQALASIEDGKGYRVFTEVGENKFYLTTTGTLVASKEQAASFNFKAVTIDNGAYPTGWNLGCKFTNPSLTNGSTGDIVQNGKINVEKKSDRNDWERQVFFLKDGKYAVRATNAKGSNWGANTYWTVTNTEAELPNADYSLDMNYVWQIEDSSFDLLMKDLNDIIARGNAFAVECGEESLAALNAIDVAALTTSEQVAAAIAEAKSIITNYIAGVEYTGLLNVTTAVVVNPTPMTIDGWEGDSFGDASDGVCEYWNKAAADFHQTVTLPAGNYRLTVVALQRVNQTGVVYAGENKTTIVQVASSVANKRAEAADWFAAGNGKNEVYFNMAEAGDIVIGLTADATTPDYWTVWQSFKLEKVGEFYTVSVAETENGTVTADKLVGIEGTKVTLTITPAEGYELDVLTVKAGENDVEVSENTFVMPAGNVTVSASFKLIPVAADITLASVTYGGEAVTFDENKAATIEGAYDAEKELVVVATAAEDVTVDVAYPTEVGETQIVITVADKDTENFPDNKATYTITFSVATGINAFATEDGKAVIYDMNGRRVSRNAKGVLIINGKKQLIK